MKKINQVLLAGAAAFSFAAAAGPSLAQTVPGPGDFNDETPTTPTNPPVTTTVDNDITVDNDVNVDNDINFDPTVTAHGGEGGQGGQGGQGGDADANADANANATANGGSATANGGNADSRAYNGGNQNRIEYNNVNLGAANVTGAINAESCTGLTSRGAGLTVAGTGATVGWTRLEEIPGCAKNRRIDGMLNSGNDQLVAVAVGTLVVDDPNGFGQSVPATANAAGAAEARCGQGASGNLFNIFNTEGYCLRDNVRDAETAPLVNIQVSSEAHGGTVEAAAPAATAARRTAAPRTTAPRRATTGARTEAPAVQAGATCPVGTTARPATQCVNAQGQVVATIPGNRR